MGRAPVQVREPLGGQQVPVPGLAGPVGAPDPRYPGINRPGAVAQVDALLGQIAELRNAPTGTGGVTPARLAMSQAVFNYRQDRPGAIAGFQRAAMVGTPDERQFRVILPDGKTWRALFAYARMAGELDTMRDRQRNARDFVHTGQFDHPAFLAEAERGLRANRHTVTKFHAGSLQNFDRMLGFMEGDSRIIDIRWMACILGTAYWEAAMTVVTGQRPNGRPIRSWLTITPISETGKGGTRDYARPVKVERLGATKARITEWDGDVFEIDGASYTVPRGMDGGAAFAPPAAQAYARSPGTEHAYYGRGYVQLTWWYHYAAAGMAIGRGHELLHNPELANDPDIAYRVMADGMITGRHYANGRRIQNYIYGDTTNYTGARAIVNAANPEPVIVEASEVFEAALLAARR